ncbi:MAG: tetratricopeptide repeat protein [Alphaproteobacteria bacterium]|nr:tetratricopeptide repeat protein [Alphaproteobacteria bacterium]
MIKHLPLLAFFAIAALTLSGCATGPATSGNAGLDSALESAAARAEAGGNNAEALALMEKYYARNPQNPEVALRFAKSLRANGELNKANLVLGPFAKDAKASAAVLNEYAMLQMDRGEFKAAETTARKLIKLDENNYEAWQVLGISLDAQTFHEQSETAFRKALEHAKGDKVPLMNNLALSLAAQEKVDEAIEILREAKRMAPNRTEVERNLRIISTLNEKAGPYVPSTSAPTKEKAGAAADEAKTNN